MGVDHFETDEVHILNTSSTRIDPATEGTLDSFKSEAHTDSLSEQSILSGILSQGAINERSTVNQSFISPGPSSTFEGGWERVDSHGSLVAVVVSTEQLADAKIEWSADGVSALPDSGTFDLIEDTSLPGLYVYFKVVQETRQGPYARLSVTTDVNDPVLFTTDLFLNKHQFNGFYENATDNPGVNALYLLTRSILATVRTDGSIGNLVADIDGHLLTASSQTLGTENNVVLSDADAETSRMFADAVTTQASDVMTSASASFTNTDVGSRVTGAGIPNNTYIRKVESATEVLLTKKASVTATGVPITLSYLFHGIEFETRSRSVQENLTVLAAVMEEAVAEDLGGCLVIQYHPDDGAGNPLAATIQEVAPFESFKSVQSPGWLSNAGDYYSVRYTPERPLVSGELVVVSTVHSKNPGNDFKRRPGQTIEEGFQFLPMSQVFLKGFDNKGNSRNIRVDQSDALRVIDDSTIATQSGSRFTESIRDDIDIRFTKSEGQSFIDNELVDAAPGLGGSVVHDPVEGQAVFDTDGSPGAICFQRSRRRAKYETGHTIRGEQTIELSTRPAGDWKVYWGYFDTDDAGNILNWIGWGEDIGGTFTGRIKNSVVVNKTYLSDANRDKIDGSSLSQFFTEDGPIVHDVTNNGIYTEEFEWLGIAPPSFRKQTPYGRFPLVHVEETSGTQKGTTVPDPEMHLAIYIQGDSTTGDKPEVRSGSWRGGLYTGKAIITGEILNAALESQDDIQYGNVPLLENGGLLTANPPRDVAIASHVAFGALGPGSIPGTFDLTLDYHDIANGIYDSGFIEVPAKGLNHDFNARNSAGSGVLKLYLIDAEDNLGTNSATTSFLFPIATLNPGENFNLEWKFVKKWFRIIAINDSVSSIDGWYIGSRGTDAPANPLTLSLNQPLLGDFPGIVGQHLIKAENELFAGLYEAIKSDGAGRLLVNAGSDFSRLLQRNVENTHKLKLDVEPTNSTHYIGTAVTATAESATEWQVIAIKLSATKNPTDMEFVEGIAWDDRTNASHWTFTP